MTDYKNLLLLKQTNKFHIHKNLTNFLQLLTSIYNFQLLLQ